MNRLEVVDESGHLLAQLDLLLGGCRACVSSLSPLPAPEAEPDAQPPGLPLFSQITCGNQTE